jgi:uncharacterized coiled-coil DUF342 family protein
MEEMNSMIIEQGKNIDELGTNIGKVYENINNANK